MIDVTTSAAGEGRIFNLRVWRRHPRAKLFPRAGKGLRDFAARTATTGTAVALLGHARRERSRQEAGATSSNLLGRRRRDDAEKNSGGGRGGGWDWSRWRSVRSTGGRIPSRRQSSPPPSPRRRSVPHPALPVLRRTSPPSPVSRRLGPSGLRVGSSGLGRAVLRRSERPSHPDEQLRVQPVPLRLSLSRRGPEGAGLRPLPGLPVDGR